MALAPRRVGHLGHRLRGVLPASRLLQKDAPHHPGGVETPSCQLHQRRWDTSPYRRVHQLTFSKVNKAKWPRQGTLAWAPRWRNEQPLPYDLLNPEQRETRAPSVHKPSEASSTNQFGFSGASVSSASSSSSSSSSSASSERAGRQQRDDQASSPSPSSSSSSPSPSSSSSSSASLLTKRLGAALLLSKTDALALIQRHRVTVNGHLQKMERWLTPQDEVAVSGHLLEELAETTYWLHKPPGVLLTPEDPLKRPTFMRLLPDKSLTLSPISRLDDKSSGLMLLTNRRSLADLLASGSPCATTYEVVLKQPLHSRHLARLERGETFGRWGPPTSLHAGVDPEFGDFHLRIEHDFAPASVLRTALGRLLDRNIVAYGGLSCVALGELNLETLGLEEEGACRPATETEIQQLVASAARPRTLADAQPPGLAQQGFYHEIQAQM